MRVLALIGFDACLMGAVEIAYQFRPGNGGFSAQVMVASPANEWGSGWSYKSILARIRAELDERVAWFERQNKLIEAQRLQQRTMYDLEMLREIGYCPGIENYSRHLSGRVPGSRSPKSCGRVFGAGASCFRLLAPRQFSACPNDTTFVVSGFEWRRRESNPVLQATELTMYQSLASHAISAALQMRCTAAAPSGT
jgi:hypothetical protein